MNDRRRLRNELKRIRCAIQSAKRLSGDGVVGGHLIAAEKAIGICLDRTRREAETGAKREGGEA